MSDPSETEPVPTVYVVGAGFSKALGYPLTAELLKTVPRSNLLDRIIDFHYPRWNGGSNAEPDIEQFLTALDANRDLLPALPRSLRFTPESLEEARNELLQSVVRHFHRCHTRKTKEQRQFLDRFARRVREENAVIISFNWDYELDRALFDDDIGPSSYGLSTSSGLPVLLKPHGSLNWYVHSQGRHIKEKKRILLWQEPDEHIHCFLRWREPQTSHNRNYIPWIVPPTQSKSFKHRMLRSIWASSVGYLSRAREVYFLGYSQPIADWHSRYILRCGFHNQVDGIPPLRKEIPGRARVSIINPDEEAFRRIQNSVGWSCFWNPAKVENWLGPS